jgi:pyruvate, orthophosphate dikinase
MVDFYPIVPGSPLPSGGPQEVGNKAWNLMRLADAGLPVPPAFVLPTSWGRRKGIAEEKVRWCVDTL